MLGMKITRQWTTFVAVAAVLSLALTACGGSPSKKSSSTPIRIGALFPTSGTLAALGNASLGGVQAAVAMTNADGGINGRKIELVTGDASLAAAAVSEATRLTTKEGVKIVLGTYASDLALAASGAAIRNGAFYWETDAISDALTSRGLSNFFQFPYTASANGANAANMIKDLVDPVLGHPAKVVIVHNDSSYGTLVASGAEKQAKANGLDVLGNYSYPTDTNDQSSLALRIRQASPDAVIASSYQNDAVLLLKSLSQQNVNLAAFIGTGGIYGLPAFAAALGSSANGLLDTEGSPDIPDKALTPDAQKLRQRFFAQWKPGHGDAAPSFLPTIAFDATWVLLHDVIAKAKSDDPADLRTAAQALDMPEGSTILGYGVKFGDKRANERASVVGDQWQDGKLVVVYPAKSASGKPISIPLPAWSKR
jgi:branched-chain amino acid transport system substrate-binding protein